MKNNLFRLLVGVILLTSTQSLLAKTYDVSSPNGKLTARIAIEEQCQLSILLDGKELMAPSTIGLTIAEGKQPFAHAKVARTKKSKIDEIITSPMYRQPSFQFAANQLDIKLKNGFGLIVLASDEGIAYRFYSTAKGDTYIYNETADYNFGTDRSAWLAYTTNKEKPYAMAFQNIYHHTALGNAQDLAAFLPATVDCGAAKVTLLETDVVSYPGMFVRANDGQLKAEFAPYPKAMDYYRWRGMSYVKETEAYIARHTPTPGAYWP